MHQDPINKKPTLADELRKYNLLDLAKEAGLPISDIPKENALNAIITDDNDTIEAKERANILSNNNKINVLIIGNTGTGKELFARVIHGNKKGRFIGINTTGIPDGLLESEFFGSVIGAFTGASNRKGLIEEAENGTLFLDEIGDMPMLLQAKLLRALQEREIRPVGSNKIIKFNCRIVSATNRKIEELSSGFHGFRSDLYYRLAGSIILLKPLKDRGDDYLKIMKVHNLDNLDENVLMQLKTKDWLGNIRELLNWVEEYKMFNKDKNTNNL